MNYTKQTDEVIYGKTVTEMDNTEMINLALAILDQCGATKDQTKSAAHFFADKLEDVDNQGLWPLIDDSSN
jgi:hypothetical protein